VTPDVWLIGARLRYVALSWETKFMRLRRPTPVWLNRPAITALLLTAIASWRALAGSSGLPDALQACTLERDDSKRLACYDREVAHLAAKPDKSFGLSPQQQTKLEPPEARDKPKPQTLSSTVSAVSQRADGRNVVTLANGQVWLQGEAWTAMPVSVGDTISIKPGALGSFKLYAPSGIAIWVTRAR
jgi:hypothetical protein